MGRSLAAARSSFGRCSSTLRSRSSLLHLLLVEPGRAGAARAAGFSAGDFADTTGLLRSENADARGDVRAAWLAVRVAVRVPQGSGLFGGTGARDRAGVAAPGEGVHRPGTDRGGE